MNDSEIKVGPHGTTFAGPDAVEFFRVQQLRMALGILSKGMTMRHLSKTRALQLAGQRTGKTYKRGEYERARADLHLWLIAAAASLPIIKED